MEAIKYDGIVVHFGELWLKGRNRSDFIKKLLNNINAALSPKISGKIELLRDRIVINVQTKEEISACEKVLKYTFGISWYSPFIKSENSIEKIITASKLMFENGESVRIEAHRSNKSVGFTSKEIVSEFLSGKEELGFIPEKFGEKTLYIEVLDKFTMLHLKKKLAPGGLPVGVSGKAVVLLSGGIDSPVAAYYAMKRGLEPIFLHIYAYPNASDISKSKMPSLLNELLKYSGMAKVYYVPSHIFQMAAMKENQKYEVVMFKRFIYEVAQSIANSSGSKIIVTGESLGQVSSQTAENLIASSAGIHCLVFRPLIGFDKQEIINVSKSLGIYNISILPYKDACSLRSRNPVTRISVKALDSIYKRAGISDLPNESIEKAQAFTMKPEY